MFDPITGAALAPKTRSKAMPRAASAAMADMKKSKPAPTPKPTRSAKTAPFDGAEPAKAATPAKATKIKKFEPPKNLALCADMYYQKREQRLALERQAALVQAEESACREALIQNLPKSEASGISGKLCRVLVENKDVYTVKDWDGVWGFILKNVKKMPGLTGMLQRRINEGMVKEMVEAGTKIPGVEKLEVPVVRMNKL